MQRLSCSLPLPTCERASPCNISSLGSRVRTCLFLIDRFTVKLKKLKTQSFFPIKNLSGRNVAEQALTNKEETTQHISILLKYR